MATSSPPYLAPSLKEQGYIGVTGMTPHRPATTEQVQTLQQQYQNSFIPNASYIAPANATTLSFNFDGTKNIGAFPEVGESSTNVYQLAADLRRAERSDRYGVSSFAFEFFVVGFYSQKIEKKYNHSHPRC